MTTRLLLPFFPFFSPHLTLPSSLSVFMAKHKSTGSYVAIKRLKKVEVLRLKQVEHVLSEKTILLEGAHARAGVCVCGSHKE